MPVAVMLNGVHSASAGARPVQQGVRTGRTVEQQSRSAGLLGGLRGELGGFRRGLLRGFRRLELSLVLLGGGFGGRGRRAGHRERRRGGYAERCNGSNQDTVHVL